MRPDIDDILSGVQRLLQNDLVPALAAQPFLVEQAMYANLILEYCKKTWTRAHLALAEEHADLRDTLLAATRELAIDPAAADLTAGIRRALDEAACDVAATTLDVVAARNRALREQVTRAVEYLEAHPRPAASARIEAYLARLAQRQYRELQQLGLTW